MRISNDAACTSYVNEQLRDFLGRRPAWHAARPPSVPEEPLTWTIGRNMPGADGWYRLQADMPGKQFLVWFGNHQVGAEGLHWIMRPAVHIAFDDLRPRNDSVGLHFSLSDVLDCMAASLDTTYAPVQYPLNTFSFT